MALFGLPSEVVAGGAAGLSASFFTLFELDNDTALAQALFGSRMKAVITSTSGSFLVGYLVNPLAGITFELFFYPACWYKSRRVVKTLEHLCEVAKPGETHEVEYPEGSGDWHEVRFKEPPQPRTDSPFPVAPLQLAS